MSESKGMSAPLRDRIFDAVLEELVVSGIDVFNIDGVARRAGVDADVIRAQWRDRRILLMEAMVARADQFAPCPDEGSLSSDVLRVAASLEPLFATDQGRQWLHRVLPRGRDADLSEVGADFWAIRMAAMEPMLRRAAERGELRVGVDPREATRILAGAIHYDVIFNDAPMRPEYTSQVHDIFLYGVLGGQAYDSSLVEDFESREHMRALLRATTDAMIDPVALVEAVRDDDGHVIDFTFREVNPAACSYLQRPREELLAGSMIETLPDIESSGMLARYVHSVDTGEPLIIEDVAYFSQRYQEIRWYDLRASRAGRDWLSMTWRDVTDRYRAYHQAEQA